MTPVTVGTHRAVLRESPGWDARSGLLAWIDHPGRALLSPGVLWGQPG